MRGALGGTAAVVVVVIVGVAAGPARGAELVSSTADSGPGSLRQVIANAPEPGVEIDLVEATYALTSGPLVIDKRVALRGIGADLTAIRSSGPFRVIEVTGGTLELSRLTIGGGHAFGTVAAGGGIYAGPDTGLSLREVTVGGNLAAADGGPGEDGGTAAGGGIYATEAQVLLASSRIFGNTATATGGEGAAGGTAVGGGIAVSDGTLRAFDTAIEGNSALAQGGRGTAEPAQEGGAASGGGLSLSDGGSPAPGASRLEAIGVVNNVADASGGAGGAGTDAEGGGAAISSGGEVHLGTATFALNGARADGSPGGQARGGGLVTRGDPARPPELLGGTIAQNSVRGGEALAGNLLAEQGIAIGNTIVSAGVGSPGTENCGNSTDTQSLGFNIDSVDQCGFHGNGDRVGTDPALGPLQDNGGVGMTMEPLLGGPAVDQGGGFGVTRDARGAPRPIDFPTLANSIAPGADGSDVGAVEATPATDFGIAKIRRNRRNGRGTVVVVVPGPVASDSSLLLVGRGLKRQQKPIPASHRLRLRLIPTGAMRRALFRKGHRKVRIELVYSPTRYWPVPNWPEASWQSGVTKERGVTLVRKKRGKKRHRHKRTHHVRVTR